MNWPQWSYLGYVAIVTLWFLTVVWANRDHVNVARLVTVRLSTTALCLWLLWSGGFFS